MWWGGRRAIIFLTDRVDKKERGERVGDGILDGPYNEEIKKCETIKS